MTSLSLLRGKIILNIFSFRGHRILKPRSEFSLKNLIFLNSKLSGRKLRFNSPLIDQARTSVIFGLGLMQILLLHEKIHSA